MPEYNIGVRFGAEGLNELKKSVNDLNVPFVALKKNLAGLTFPKFNAGAAADELGKLPPVISQSVASLESYKKTIAGLKTNIAGGIIPKLSFVSIDQLQSKLNDIRSKLTANTNPALFKGLNTEAVKAQTAITALNKSISGTKSPLNELNPAVGRANYALLNLGRVAQDAPFGLIGIANNIEPLIQSFQALGREAKNNGGVLSALGKSLIGPGGLLLAFSGLSFVASGGIETIKKFFAQFGDANKDITKAKEFLAELRTSMNIKFEAQGSVAGEIAEVTALASVVRDETAAKKERLAAIEQLKKINKSYFGDLSLEKSAIAGLAKVQEEYTQALVQQAVIKGFSEEISKTSVELFRQKQVLSEAGKQYLQSETNLSKLQQRYKDFDKTGKSININLATSSQADAQVGIARDNVEKASKAYNQQLEIVNKLTKSYNDYNTEINKAVGASLKLKPLSTDTGSGSETDTLQKRLNKLKEIQKTQEEIVSKKVSERAEIDIDIKGADALEIEKNKIARRLEEVRALIETSQKIYELEVQISVRDAQKNGLSADELNKLKKGYESDLQKYLNLEPAVLEGSVEVKPQVNINTAGINADSIESVIAKKTGLDKEIKSKRPIRIRYERAEFFLALDGGAARQAAEKLAIDFSTTFANLVGQAITDSFVALGEGIAAAFAGDGLKGLVTPLLNVIANALTAIGKAAIEYGVKMALIKKSLALTFKNPAVAIGAGIALVAAGSLLRTKVNNSLPKFRDGGIADGPLSGYQVELHGREMIIPLDRLNNAPTFGSKDSPAFLPSISFSGDMFKIMLDKVNQRKSRV